MNIEEQLNIIGKRLCDRMQELDITPRIIQQRSGLALNSVKTALQGKKCNVGTLANICQAMSWTLFDLFNQGSDNSAKVAEPPASEDTESKPTSIV